MTVYAFVKRIENVQNPESLNLEYNRIYDFEKTHKTFYWNTKLVTNYSDIDETLKPMH